MAAILNEIIDLPRNIISNYVSADGIPDLASETPKSDLNINLSLFNGWYESEPSKQLWNLSLDEVYDLVTNHGKPHITENKHDAPYVCSELKTAPWVAETKKKKDHAREADPTVPYIGIQRSASHCVGSSILKLDGDDVLQDEYDTIISRLEQSGLTALVFSTFKHGLKDGFVRCRIILIFDEQAATSEYVTASEVVGRVILGKSYDSSEHNPYQLAGCWTVHPDRLNSAFCRRISGALVSLKKATELARIMGIGSQRPNQSLFRNTTDAVVLPIGVDELTRNLMGRSSGNDPFPLWKSEAADFVRQVVCQPRLLNGELLSLRSDGANPQSLSPTQESGSKLILSMLRNAVDTAPEEYRETAHAVGRAIYLEYAYRAKDLSVWSDTWNPERDWDERRVGGLKAVSPWCILNVAKQLGIKTHAVTGAKETSDPTDLNLNKRDITNARAFVTQYADSLRYVHAEKVWFKWNGFLWVRCERNEQTELAKAFVDGLYEQYMRLRKEEPEGDRATTWLRHCQYSATKKALDNMLDLAKSDQRIAVASMEDFDSDPFIFQVANGVIDLHSGQLLEPDPSRLISRSSPVNYVSGATCPNWQRFLGEVFPGDPQTVETVQRWMGYTLCGDVSEEILLVELGVGANGKSVRDYIHRHVMGSYARAIASGVITTSGEDDASKPTPEIASLCGLRYGSINETQASDRLNETGVKRIAGTERIAARQLYGKSFEFTPTAKCAVRTNHRPVVFGTDEGIWRRLLLVRYPRHFAEEERDRDLRVKLIAEAEGILAWMVDGFRKWQSDGLKPSPNIKRELAAYRKESDVLGEFLDGFKFDPDGMISERILYDAYRLWCGDNGHRACSKSAFTRQLAERNIGQVFNSKAGGKCYLGIRSKLFDGHK